MNEVKKNSIDEVLNLGRYVWCLQMSEPSTSLSWVYILFYSLLYFLGLSIVANGTWERVSFLLVHELESDLGFCSNLCNPIFDNEVEEFSVFILKLVIFSFLFI